MLQYSSRIAGPCVPSSKRRAAPAPARDKVTARRRAVALTLESLESRTLLSSTPIGSVDVLSRTTIAGWAMNSDDGTSAINVQITINGTMSTVTANRSRPDLAIPLGSPYHAYTFTMPTLPPGNSTVLVQAISASTGAVATLTSTTINNPPPIGGVDLLTGNRIAGWVYDPDSTAPIRMRIDVDGNPGTAFTTNVARPDVAAVFHVNNLGFDVSGSYAGHVVEVYAMDNPTNTPVLIYSNNKLPKGNVDVNNGFTVAGWAVDPDSPSASINVRVDIDGVTLAGTPASANLTRGDLVSLFGSANHGFSIPIPGLTPGTHTISVYAIDGQSSSAAPLLIGSKTVTDAPPIGHVDVVNSNIVAGWALDPDLGAGSTTVNVYVDDALFSTVSASVPRPDLAAAFGTPNHGFAVNLSSVAAGSHSITVTAVDNRTSDENEVVIFDDFINNHTPIGNVDFVTGTKVNGWAYDQDAGNSPIQVDVYIDGIYASTTTANMARPDVDAYLNSPNHAFSADLPVMPFGSHRIDVYAAESQGNVSVLIGSKTVINQRPIGSIDTISSTLVTGWAADPDRPGQQLTIDVYVNGVLFTNGTGNLPRPDLLAAVPILNTTAPFNRYGYSLPLTLSAGRNQIDVYAVDPNNNILSPLGSKVIMV